LCDVYVSTIKGIASKPVYVTNLVNGTCVIRERDGGDSCPHPVSVWHPSGSKQCLTSPLQIVDVSAELQISVEEVQLSFLPRWEAVEAAVRVARVDDLVQNVPRLSPLADLHQSGC
jgi:hypothetical protein